MAEPVKAGEPGGPPRGKRPIGSLFVEKGMVTPAQLDEALERQKETGERLGEVLVELGYVSRIELASAIGDQLVELRLLQGGSGQQAAAPAAPAAPAASAPAAPDRSAELQAEIETRDRRIANQSQSIDELLDRVNALEKQLREHAKAGPDAELRAERDSLASRVEELERNLANAAPDPAEAERLAQLARERDALAAHVEELEGKLAEAVPDPAETAALSGEREGLLAAIAEHGWRVGELEAELGTHIGAAAQLRARIEELQTSVAERESNLAREASAAAGTRSRIAGLEAELAKLQRRLGESTAVAPASVPEPEPVTAYVLCIAAPSGYRLLDAEGVVPAAGEAVSVPGTDEAYVVVRVGTSPLPDDARICAFAELVS
jgi:DNA repair exonuclease SbcCD ATPase subunit